MFMTVREEGRRYIASVSFGKDSVAMILMLIEKGYPLDEVVFYDTGMEFNAIYHVRDKIAGMLDDLGIKYTEMHPDRTFLYDMLEKPVTCRDTSKGTHFGYGWCGGPCRWGTRAKLTALDKYARQQNAIVYIGIAADEPQRLEKLDSYKRAPLAEWGVTEAEALQFCRNNGISWLEGSIDLYDILDRVSCWCCGNKNQKELKNIWKYLPEYWNRLLDLQDRIGKPMKKFRTDPVYGDLGDLHNLGMFWEAEAKTESDAAASEEPSSYRQLTLWDIMREVS